MSYKVNNVTVIDNERNISSSGIVTVGLAILEQLLTDTLVLPVLALELRWMEILGILEYQE